MVCNELSDIKRQSDLCWQKDSKALIRQSEYEWSIELMRPQYTHHQVFLNALTAELLYHRPPNQ